MKNWWMAIGIFAASPRKIKQFLKQKLSLDDFISQQLKEMYNPHEQRPGPNVR